ncbi:MAG: hypothetical protein ACO3JL_21125, partial [Myxococcota bacterium]
ARRPSEKWLNESKKHHARTATVVKGREMVRDFLAAGYCVFNCSGLSFSSTRDEHGVAKQTPQGWMHAQHWLGYDDREETVKLYGQPLVLWQNSWAKWNRGPRRIRGTSIDIPEGGYWSLASTIDRCSCIALSSVAGWPRRNLPTYGAEGNV